MGLAKPSIPKTQVESQDTLINKTETIPTVEVKAMPIIAKPAGRDFDAEARGKTRCALFAAALQSPVVAQLCMTMNGIEEALKVVEQAAEAGVKYTFGNK